MAIYHCSMKVIARSGGRSAVAAVAYRTASKLLNERDGLVHDFTRKQGIVHSEIVLPDGVDADWARDRSKLWNAAERVEKRCDARVAREFEIALPHELSAEQRLSLVRDFAADLANTYRAAVDFAIHQPHVEGDVRNVHAHVLMTTRKVEAHGLGEKTLIERENKWLLNNNQPTSHMQLRDIRQAFEHHANRHLARAGLDIRIDHRSHLERGLEIEPTEHMGVFASQMDRRGLDVSRARLDEKAARRNAALIRERPEQVLSILTGEKSVFDRYDVARALHRYIDDPVAFRNAFASVMASSALVELRGDQDGELARYSTKEMLAIEHTMASRASRMGGARGHGVDRHAVDRALSVEDNAIKATIASALSEKVALGQMRPVDRARIVARAGLSGEQRAAVEHLTGPEQIAAVVGFAGAGKSTMLAAARRAWESQGYRVHGAALAGKAAEGLEQSSGIASRTLASLEYRWQAGRGVLGKGDVLVIDEAGMVGSRQLARFVGEAEARGAKLVLVGDHEQLQAIGAGSPFRAIVERIGAVELSEIRRQTEDWQRDASIAFATHRTADGLAAYADKGALSFFDNRQEACSALVRDYIADLEVRGDGSRVALAHRRADVRAINTEIRTMLQDRGRLAKGEIGQEGLGREIVYQTNDGKRSFASGDRIVLLENNRDLNVKNGMLGTVLAVEPDALQIRLDGSGHSARAVSIPVKSYQAFDHGYATTIHKSQGSTVDRALVMASATMDRHLTYVAMTRHRQGVSLYAGRDELKDIETLSKVMGRSGVKETTLDYLDTFAARRGIGEALGIHSEIDIAASIGGNDERPAAHYGAPGERVRSPVARLPGDVSRTRRDRENSPDVSQRPEPLLPAVQRYTRSVEDLARDRARSALEQAMDAVRSVAGSVYRDPAGVTAAFATAIIDQGADGKELARHVAERPEQFGTLLGKAGLLGDNKDRRMARHSAQGLSHHVASVSQTWERRLEAERASETWYRQHRDGVEVPGLTAASEAILRQFDDTPRGEKPKLLEQLAASPDGARALEEARTITQALEKRLGTSDLRSAKQGDLRLGPEVTVKLDRIKEVASLVDRARRAEMSQAYELKRSLGKGLGLGM